MDKLIQHSYLLKSTAWVDQVSDWLLGLSIILAGAPGFRMSGMPVGPGEACLLSWIGLRICQKRVSQKNSTNLASRVLVIFWVLFVSAQCLGLLISMVFDELIEWSIVFHDVTAFTLMLLFSTLCQDLPNVSFRLARITRHATVFGCISLSLQVASAYNLLSVSGIDPWYWDRFRGWSDNPNQLSLFCAILVPIALFGYETSEQIVDRCAALGCAAAAFMAGILTKGNSLRLALTIGLSCSVLVFVARVLFRGGTCHRPRALVVAFVVVSTPLVLMSCLPFVVTFKAEDLAQQVSRDSTETMSEAALRFELWNEALSQGIRSFYLGLGPGPHARVPLEIAVRQRWEPGADDPSRGDVATHGAVMESHNTYLELFSQGGGLIVLAYVALLVFATRQSIASRSIALPSLVCVIASFSFFHVVLRHPIVWFGLCLCLGSTYPPVLRFRVISTHGIPPGSKLNQSVARAAVL